MQRGAGAVDRPVRRARQAPPAPSGRLVSRSAFGVAFVAAAALAGCGEYEPSSPTPADLEAIDLSPDHTVTVDEDGFHPGALKIGPGEVVLLVNEGEELHSFTAPEHFDTGRLEPGEEVTLLLSDPGEITYEDLENPDARGTLTIVASDD